MDKKQDQFEAVDEFMRVMDQEIPPTPQIPSLKVRVLRADLITEEVIELFKAFEKASGASKGSQDEKVEALVEVADAICDVMYVVAGTASAFGLLGSEIFKIVHETNMAKLGGPVREDGKREKPPGWQPPQPKLRTLIESLRQNYIPPPEPQISGSPWEGDYGRAS